MSDTTLAHVLVPYGLAPERGSDRLRDRLMRLSLVITICFPFNVYLPFASFVSLVLGCSGVLLCVRRLPQPPVPMVISTLILLIYLAATITLGDDWKRCIGTSNHMFQWIFATYAFYTAFYNGAFETGRLLKFIPYLAIGHLVSAVLLGLDIGQQPWEANPLFYEHNLLTFFTIFVLARLAADRCYRYALPSLVVYLLLLTVLTDRPSVQAVNAAILITIFLRIPPSLLTASTLFILFFPIYAALTLSTSELQRLIGIDFNTYMRMEFIRGASAMMRDHVLFGVGFDTLYRPLNYAYSQVHPLLNDPKHMASVNNHHSIFDTFLRFGLLLAPVFLWPIFRQIYIASTDRAVQAAILFQAFGLSFNAYFEQQSQVSTVCFITAFLLVANRNPCARVG